MLFLIFTFEFVFDDWASVSGALLFRDRRTLRSKPLALELLTESFSLLRRCSAFLISACCILLNLEMISFASSFASIKICFASFLASSIFSFSCFNLSVTSFSNDFLNTWIWFRFFSISFFSSSIFIFES